MLYDVHKFPCWKHASQVALLALNNAVNDLGISPSMVMYGEQLALPSLLFSEERTYPEDDIDDFIANLAQDMREMRKYNFGKRSYNERNHSRRTVLIINRDGKIARVNVDRTKPAYRMREFEENELDPH